MFEKLKLEKIIQNHGFSHWGTAALERPLTLSLYKDWLEAGMAGKMEYLHRHVAQKEKPQLLAHQAQGAIVLAKEYLPHPYPDEAYPFKSESIAKYARGTDYHLAFQNEMIGIIEDLQEQFPQEHFVSFTDSAPVLERDLAYRAGLGWFGKNTCLIDRKKGSYFLIGEIYTSIIFSEQNRVQDFCGTCTRCMDACPTGAIVDARKLDARRCISYMTIESSEIPEPHTRSMIGAHLFGCDICQDVCPWNRKHIGPPVEMQDEKERLVSDLRYVLLSSNKALQKQLATTALSRSAGFKLKRNAIIVVANAKLHELRAEVELYQNNERLGELANWCLDILNG